MFNGYKFFWVSSQSIAEKEKELKSRFSLNNTELNTRKYHCYKPCNEYLIEVKFTSFHKQSKIIKIIK